MAKVPKEALEDGKILMALLARFMQDPKAENYYPVLDCLCDSDLFILMDDNTNKPCVLKAEDELFMPIFSQEEQIVEDLKNNYSVERIPMNEVIELANKQIGLHGVVVDPNSFKFELTMEVLNALVGYMAER